MSLPFATGYIGIIPYDYCNINESFAGRAFRVNESLVWDHHTKKVFLCGERREQDVWKLPPALLALQASQTRLFEAETEIDGGYTLRSQRSDQAYLSMVDSAIADIRRGRYYQINLLRYYDVGETPTRQSLLKRIEKFGGPFSSYFDFPDFVIASLSPERFMEALPSPESVAIRTEPIKGTAGRAADPNIDAQLARQLLTSAKDNAELHIIVDLLRNDLNRICKQGSVKVKSPGHLVSFSTVHHLVAEITGELQSPTTLDNIWAQTAPGGSITGAPKREVMTAISDYEGRPRGFFMGSAFYLDDQGHFDSSLLIRTGCRLAMGPFEYAAGSGITISSSPTAELAEINHKCRVLTESI